MKPRDRESAKGLLPRMEARPRKDGLTTYRYHPFDGKPINLGTDRRMALQKVLDMLGISDDRGTIGRLWEQYQDTPGWKGLKPRTRADYEDYSVPLLQVFGKALASVITAPDVARYLRQKRAEAPVRANREIALLGNLIGLAIERGEATANPCRGGLVKRNTERPLDVLPEAADIQALIAFAAQRDADVKTKIGRSTVVMLAAEFAALTGARQAEFLPLHWPAFEAHEVRLDRAKQRTGVKKVDRIAVSEALASVRTRLLAFQTSPMGAVFPNRAGNVYTASGFASMWQKLIVAALAEGAITERFNFHALRAFYATQHKTDTGTLPDMHASPTTTARIYERSKVGRRKSL
jgi:integrase